MSDELESGDFAQLVVPAWYRPCVHGGGWWETEDVDGRKVLLGSETPTLDAMVAKAREDALREAAERLLGSIKREYGDHRDYRKAILRMIDRTAEGEA